MNFRVLVLGAILLLSGCYNWTEVVRPATTVRWIKTDIATVQSIPGCDRFDILACAISFTNNVCVVLATSELDKTPQLIVDHEMHHCDGFSHGKDPA